MLLQASLQHHGIFNRRFKGLKEKKKKIISNWRSEQVKWKYFECDNLRWYFMNCSFVSPGHCFLALITVIRNHFPSVKCAACLQCWSWEREHREGCRSIPEGTDPSLPVPRCPPCPVPLCTPSWAQEILQLPPDTCKTLQQKKCFWANPAHFGWQ